MEHRALPIFFGLGFECAIFMGAVAQGIEVDLAMEFPTKDKIKIQYFLQFIGQLIAASIWFALHWGETTGRTHIFQSLSAMGPEPMQMLQMCIAGSEVGIERFTKTVGTILREFWIRMHGFLMVNV
jgi:hypothetical protein